MHRSNQRELAGRIAGQTANRAVCPASGGPWVKVGDDPDLSAGRKSREGGFRWRKRSPGGGVVGSGLIDCLDADVAQVANHFQDLAARGKHPPIGSLVSIQGLHELDFFGRIVPLACRGIDLATTRDLAALHADLNVLLASVLTCTPIDLHLIFIALGHDIPLLLRPQNSGTNAELRGRKATSTRRAEKVERLGKMCGCANLCA